ncbi:IS5 family transposase [Phaeobacter inhibens]|uniref:IS5 family transposase n=1 Tax=Phaeobacter inhibens TaxID=221822 RepID=UPI0021A739E8|nr:IS5 family transposase [Phaeobacter inhibens]UWR91074.1 IS5 family transposase [Phaeobacter inhibens]UWR91702.1 IS5 family transposase [Phaeobacter inhibens]
MSSWAPTKYKTTNWSAYNDALKRRGSLTIWFDPEMTWRAPPTGKRGRQPSFSDAAIQTCLTMKVLFGMPLRQTTGFVQSLLKLIGLDWVVPDFSTLCRRQRTLNVAIPYRGGAGPLNLLIDSTGIKAEGEGEWNARKHGGSKRRIWRKIHIGIDEETLEVRAVEVTGSNIGDAPILPELLDQIAADEQIGSVTADGAYDTRKCHEAIAARGAAAVIPPRKNAKPWNPTSPGAVARNKALRASKYLGRAIWRRWSGYHRRSRVESKMSCIKLLGHSLMARDFDRQVAELQVRIAVLNGYTALGIPVTVAVG